MIKSIALSVTLLFAAMCALTGCGGGGGGGGSSSTGGSSTGGGSTGGGGTSASTLADVTNLTDTVLAKASGTTVKLYNMGTTTTPIVDDHTFLMELADDANPTSPVSSSTWPYSTSYDIEVYVNGTLRALLTSMTNFDERNPYTGTRYRYLMFTNCTFFITTAEAASLPTVTLKLVKATPNTSIQVRSSFISGPVLVAPAAVDSTGKVNLTFSPIQITPSTSG